MEHTVFLGQQAWQYRNESQQKPPRQLQSAAQLNAAQLLQAAHEGTATVWTGDFYQAKQLLAALKKRTAPKHKPCADPREAFHKYRLAQSQHSRLANMLLLPVNADYRIDLPRAPDVQAALQAVYGTASDTPFLLPLNQLLGFIGAYEWQKKGVWMDTLQANIHVPFGVFSPIRGEYVELVRQAAAQSQARTAMDIGTGSGVLAAVLAKHSAACITATDNNPRAVACAADNIARLGFSSRVRVQMQDLLADESADLIVCNPPWLPARPTSAIETALYDPDHAMLHALLHNAGRHLNDGGELWIVMSDLAEHLGLRAADDLPNWFAQTGWRVKSSLHTAPRHAKAQNAHDPLAFARERETTTLYCLERA